MKRSIATLTLTFIVLSSIAQETVVWQETFAGGIPTNWTNAETSGIAVWQYRGPATTPDNTVGTQSLCLLANETTSAPILSPTAADGFAIFDAAWWDNPSLPCNANNAGSGLAPGPHNAVLTSPVINLSGVDYPVLEFNQYYRKSQGNTFVEYSINGAPFVQLFQNNLSAGQATARNDLQRIYFPGTVANASSLQIRFVFDGLYFFWMLDDIRILNASANDMRVESATYGDFDFFAPEHSTGYEEMEYTLYPVELAPLLKFNLIAENFGYNTQTNVKLKASVIRVADNVTLVENISDESFNFQPGTQQELRAGSFQMPAEIGQYQVVYEIMQSEEDEVPDNSSISLFFSITEDIYSRERGPLISVILPIAGQDQQTFEVGGIYHIPVAGQSLHSISVALGPGTSAPVTVYARLYKVNYGNELGLNLVGESPLVAIDAEDINLFGGNTYVNIPFLFPITLEEGSAYMATVVSPNGMSNVYVGLNGQAELNTAWVRILPNTGQPQLYSLSRIPLIRMNLGPVITDVSEDIAKHTISVFPNPVENRMNIRSEHDIVAVNIFTISGQHVFSLNEMNTHQLELDVSELAEGMYVVQTQTEKGFTSAKFIKTK